MYYNQQHHFKNTSSIDAYKAKPIRQKNKFHHPYPNQLESTLFEDSPKTPPKYEFQNKSAINKSYGYQRNQPHYQEAPAMSNYNRLIQSAESGGYLVTAEGNDNYNFDDDEDKENENDIEFIIMNLYSKMKNLEGKYIDLANFYKHELVKNNQSQPKKNLLQDELKAYQNFNNQVQRNNVNNLSRLTPSKSFERSQELMQSPGQIGSFRGGDGAAEGDIIRDLMEEKKKLEEDVKHVIQLKQSQLYQGQQSPERNDSPLDKKQLKNILSQILDDFDQTQKQELNILTQKQNEMYSLSNKYNLPSNIRNEALGLWYDAKTKLLQVVNEFKVKIQAKQNNAGNISSFRQKDRGGGGGATIGEDEQRVLEQFSIEINKLKNQQQMYTNDIQQIFNQLRFKDGILQDDCQKLQQLVKEIMTDFYHIDHSKQSIGMSAEKVQSPFEKRLASYQRSAEMRKNQEQVRSGSRGRPLQNNYTGQDEMRSLKSKMRNLDFMEQEVSEKRNGMRQEEKALEKIVGKWLKEEQYTLGVLEGMAQRQTSFDKGRLTSPSYRGQDYGQLEKKVTDLQQNNDKIYNDLRRANEKYLNAKIDNNKLKDEVKLLQSTLEESNLQFKRQQQQHYSIDQPNKITAKKKTGSSQRNPNLDNTVIVLQRENDDLRKKVSDLEKECYYHQDLQKRTNYQSNESTASLKAMKELQERLEQLCVSVQKFLLSMKRLQRAVNNKDKDMQIYKSDFEQNKKGLEIMVKETREVAQQQQTAMTTIEKREARFTGGKEEEGKHRGRSQGNRKNVLSPKQDQQFDMLVDDIKLVQEENQKQKTLIEEQKNANELLQVEKSQLEVKYNSKSINFNKLTQQVKQQEAKALRLETMVNEYKQALTQLEQMQGMNKAAVNRVRSELLMKERDLLHQQLVQKSPHTQSQDQHELEKVNYQGQLLKLQSSLQQQIEQIEDHLQMKYATLNEQVELKEQQIEELKQLLLTKLKEIEICFVDITQEVNEADQVQQETSRRIMHNSIQQINSQQKNAELERSIENVIGRFENEQREEEILKLAEDNENLLEQITNLQLQIGQLEQEVAQHRQQLSQLQQELQQKQDIEIKMNHAIQERDKMERYAQEQLKQAEQRLKQQQKAMEQVELTYQKQLNEIEIQLQGARNEYIQEQDRRVQFESEYNMKEKQNKTLKSENKFFEVAIEQLKQRELGLLQQIDNLQQEKDYIIQINSKEVSFDDSRDFDDQKESALIEENPRATAEKYLRMLKAVNKEYAILKKESKKQNDKYVSLNEKYQELKLEERQSVEQIINMESKMIEYENENKRVIQELNNIKGEFKIDEEQLKQEIYETFVNDIKFKEGEIAESTRKLERITQTNIDLQNRNTRLEQMNEKLAIEAQDLGTRLPSLEMELEMTRQNFERDTETLQQMHDEQVVHLKSEKEKELVRMNQQLKQSEQRLRKKKDKIQGLKRDIEELHEKLNELEREKIDQEQQQYEQHKQELEQLEEQLKKEREMQEHSLKMNEQEKIEQIKMSLEQEKERALVQREAEQQFQVHQLQEKFEQERMKMEQEQAHIQTLKEQAINKQQKKAMSLVQVLQNKARQVLLSELENEKERSQKMQQDILAQQQKHMNQINDAAEERRKVEQQIHQMKKEQEEEKKKKEKELKELEVKVKAQEAKIKEEQHAIQIKQLQHQYEEKIGEISQQLQDYEEKILEYDEQSKDLIDQVQFLTQAVEEKESELLQVQQDHQATLNHMKEDHDKQLKQIKARHEEQLRMAQQSHEESREDHLQTTINQYEQQIEELRNDFDEQMKEQKQKYEQQMSPIKHQKSDLQQELNKLKHENEHNERKVSELQQEVMKLKQEKDLSEKKQLELKQLIEQFKQDNQLIRDENEQELEEQKLKYERDLDQLRQEKMKLKKDKDEEIQELMLKQRSHMNEIEESNKAQLEKIKLHLEEEHHSSIKRKDSEKQIFEKMQDKIRNDLRVQVELLEKDKRDKDEKIAEIEMNQHKERVDQQDLIDQLNQQMKQLGEVKIQLTKENEKIKKDLDILKKQQKDSENTLITDMRRDIIEKEAQIEHLHKQESMLEQENQKLTQQIKAKDVEIRNLEKDLDQFGKDFDEEKTQTEDQLQELRKKMEDIQKERDTHSKNHKEAAMQLTMKQGILKQLEEKVAEKDKELTQIQQLQKDKETLTKKVHQLEEQNKVLQERLKNLNIEQNADLNNKMDEIEKKIDEFQAQVMSIEKKQKVLDQYKELSKKLIKGAKNGDEVIHLIGQDNVEFCKRSIYLEKAFILLIQNHKYYWIDQDDIPQEQLQQISLQSKTKEDDSVQLQNKLSHLVKEKDSLIGALQSTVNFEQSSTRSSNYLEKQNQDLQQQLHEMQLQNNDLQQNNLQLKKKIGELNDMVFGLTDTEKQHDNMKKIMDLHSKNEDKKNQLIDLIGQNKQLEETLDHKISEIEQLKKQLAEAEYSFARGHTNSMGARAENFPLETSSIYQDEDENDNGSNEIQVKVKRLETENEEFQRLRNDLEMKNETLEKELKKIKQSQQSSSSAHNIDHELAEQLKHIRSILIKFLEKVPLGTMENESLLPVVYSMMHFTRDEQSNLSKVRQEAANAVIQQQTKKGMMSMFSKKK